MPYLFDQLPHPPPPSPITEPYLTVGDQTYCFKHNHFQVLFFNHRMMFVKVSAPHMKMVVCVAHALDHSNYTLEQRTAWWQQLQAKCNKRQPHLMLIDANGKLGPTSSEAVGTQGWAQSEDSNGR